ALSDTVGGGNGVFAYGSGNKFPNGSWNASNYWVDVVFVESLSSEPDATAPTIASRTPASGATGVPTNSSVSITFSEAMDPTSISASTIELRNASNAIVPAVVSYNAVSNTATLAPSSALA